MNRLARQILDTLSPRADPEHGPLPPEAASHSVLAGGAGPTSGRGVVAVAILFIGALWGAALILHVRRFAALIAALVILVAVMIAAHLTGRSNPAWTSEP